MDPKPPPPPSPEEWTHKLRASLKQKRPRLVAVLLVVTTIAAGILALFLWAIYPEPAPPRLAIVAFDQLAHPGQEIELRAQIEPVEPGSIHLKGFPVVFVEGRFLSKAGEKVEQARTSSDSAGVAAVPWRLPDNVEQADFLVRLLGDKRRSGAEDRARVFLRAKETALLLVDVDCLSAEDAAAWSKKNILEILPAPGAAAALQAARNKEFQIVYLALGPARPLIHRKVRGWVENQLATSKQPFPAGPVLGRPRYAPDPQAASSWLEVFNRMKNDFRGRHAGITANLEAAAHFQAAGYTTFLLAKGLEAPAGITLLGSWEALPKKLLR